MVARSQPSHGCEARRTDLERHHHHGEPGRSWTPDRSSSRSFPRDISPIQGTPSTPLPIPPPTPSRKRKRSQSPPPGQLSIPTITLDGLRPPKYRATQTVRKPLADTQNFAIVPATPPVVQTSTTSLGSPIQNSNMTQPYPSIPITPLPPSFFSSPALAAYATANSYRQCVQLFADKHYYVMETTYHGTGPGHAQAWCAQITLKQKRGGQEIPVIDHTSAYWYSKQSDAKERTSLEVWMLLIKGV
jgi:hypothetical protein